MTKLKKYHQRAHNNPFMIKEISGSSELVEGGPGEKKFKKLKKFPTVLDLGCGFGRMSHILSQEYPNELIVGAEIRKPVFEYCESKYSSDNLEYLNLNTMQNLLNVFKNESLRIIMICFPDPHFKKKNHKKRIINTFSVPEYNYVLKKGGLICTVTDVEELGIWNEEKILESEMFSAVKSGEEYDKLMNIVKQSDEANKMKKEGREKIYFNLFQKNN